MNWMYDLFHVNKPIIAMLHLKALPGDPNYDSNGGMQKIIEAARRDLHALQQGGVDGIMFSNEFSLPYLTQVESVSVVAMARIIGELKCELTCPHGVNVLWDPMASIELAAVTDAYFVREIFTGVYASDFGLWNPNAGKVFRHRRHLDAMNVRLLFNIVPEAAQYLANRSVEDIARSTVFNHHPDALCVSGLVAGSETDLQTINRVKQAVSDTLVLANTGVKHHNVQAQLSIADGAVVGTTFKRDGIFENEVDIVRVNAFMQEVQKFRSDAGAVHG